MNNKAYPRTPNRYFYYMLVYNNGTSTYRSDEYDGGFFTSEKEARSEMETRINRHKSKVESYGDLYQYPTSAIVYRVTDSCDPNDPVNSCIKF
jgi:ribosome-associated translation inhibitor RaiA